MAIHWWHTDRLVEELARDGVTEHESLWYAILSALIAIQSLYYAYWFGGDRGWPLFMEFLAVCTISAIGLFECFKANGGTAGSHFLKRLWCLGVPLGLKLAIASAVFGQLIYFGFPWLTGSGLFREPHFVYQMASLFIAGGFTVIFYWRMAFHLARIAARERSNPLMQPTGQERPAAD
jgi:hypothetical protein